MAYTKTTWTDNVTPVSALNMNKIETGIDEAYVAVDTHAALTAPHYATPGAVASRLVLRDTNGRAKVAPPSDSDDIARKDTVDTHAAITTAPVHGSSSAATASTLMHRDASGRVKVAAPSASDDVAIKQTVDDAVTTHNNVTAPHSATSAATASRLMMRDSNGRAKVAPPAATDDIATMGYVDATKSATSGADINTLTTTGNHEIQNGTNGPSGAPAWLYIHVIKSATANYVTQTAYSREDNRTWTRRNVNNVWSAWMQLHVTSVVPGAVTTFASDASAVTNTPSNMMEVNTYKTQVDGKFRVSGQFRTSNAGTTASAALLQKPQGASAYSVVLSANTTSTTFVAFSFDSTTVLPAFGSVGIGLQATGSFYVEMQNRVISGDYFYGPISDG